MLQDYPTQIQPRPSSTRETQEQDAEAGRTLIDLANQDTSLRTAVKDKSLSQGDVGTSINNKAHHQRLQPDPIMLLAAAAAVIDEEGKYNGRSFERKEIKLQTRRHSASVTKRKTQTATNLYRRQSEKRQRPQRQPSTDTWAERTITPEEDEEIGNDSKHAFSWQYLSMKQNPRIKRNAMHAYITYMIYTDKANEQNTNEKITKNVHNKDNWYLQSYRLPPSPRQQDPPLPPTELPTNRIIDRPLTEFLFDDHRPPSPLLPPSSNARAF
ncbi:unnamed protein product [Rhizopus stolonifer]